MYGRPVPFQSQVKLRHNMYNKVCLSAPHPSSMFVAVLKQETICRIMYATNPPRYITVSKVRDGIVDRSVCCHVGLRMVLFAYGVVQCNYRGAVTLQYSKPQVLNTHEVVVVGHSGSLTAS